MEHTDWGKPSYIVTKAVGGQKLHIKLQETVYHPGHYRVALAVNSPTELPLDPQATTRDSERGPMSLAAAIQNPPQIPVLAERGNNSLPRMGCADGGDAYAGALHRARVDLRAKV